MTADSAGSPGPSTPRHLVRRAADAMFAVPAGGSRLSVGSLATGFRRWSVIGERTGAAHTGFGICELDPGGSFPAHVHSFEQSVYLTSGSVVIDTAEGSFRLEDGDYALLPVGVPHAWRNESGTVARWADLQSPLARAQFNHDTFVVPPVRAGVPRPVDPRDPRTRSFGHIAPANMDVAKQSQNMLSLSASMRTALLVYSGITVKMMIDSDLGAVLSTMFMVQYQPDGVAGGHDHPFEETYLILEGATNATFDGEEYRLEVGDIAWAGVGCVHSFTNAGTGVVRWLETQAPQPPPRHSYRFARDWSYLRDVLDGPTEER